MAVSVGHVLSTRREGSSPLPSFTRIRPLENTDFTTIQLEIKIYTLDMKKMRKYHGTHAVFFFVRFCEVNAFQT